MNQDLQSHVKQMREQGYSDEQIKEQLIRAGWDFEQLNKFFTQNGGVSQESNHNELDRSSLGKIGKFKSSKMIVRASWNLLKKDKEAMWFPIFSSVFNLLFLIIIAGVFVLTVLNGSFESLEAYSENNTLSMVEIIFLFVIYFVSFFITVFFEIGIIAIVHGRINGKNLTFKDGIKVALSRINKILIWSFLSALVGVILREIIERSKLLTRILVAIIGTTWSITTFFIVPVIALEDLSIKKSFGKSIFVIKKTWGETLIVNIGVGIYFGLLALLGVVIFLSSLFTGSLPIILIFGILLILYFLALMIIYSTLSTIFKFVLYEYASRGIVPPGFPPELLRRAFKKR